MTNADVVRTIYETVFNQDDWANAEDYLHADYVNHTKLPGAAAGIAGLQTAMKSLRTAFPDLHYTIENIISDGDFVSLRTTFTGTHQGDYLGFPATGAKVESNSIAMIRLVDGRVAERWGVMDNEAIRRVIAHG